MSNLDLSWCIYMETERLILRQFTLSDTELLFDLDSDPEVTRYTSGGQPPNRELIRDTILPRFLEYYRQGKDQGFWAVHLKSNGDFIGWFHLRALKNSNIVELGYRLKRSAWGNGYATEGSLALLDRAFTKMNLPLIEATGLAANRASIRVMEKCGMKIVGKFHEENFPGPDKDAVRYRITADQYKR